MTISAGDRLGRYEILGPLGAGGMGQVYRARDTELDRDVAIKVLPETVARDPKRLARFEREAKAVARLAHPNILEIWDYGREGEITYSVTELLEGETLRGEMADGPLPWQKAREIAATVADGLAAAHSKGVVHRDLKPENIFITDDGRVKVLDFGLARMEGPVSTEEETGTLTPAETQKGMIIGTLGYMSPEQVRGRAIDQRSDIFSLGCVLYEMLSGRRAFARDSAFETMSAIVHEQPPPFAASGVAVGPELARTIDRCLEKKPERRFQSAADLAFALRAMVTDTEARRAYPSTMALGVRLRRRLPAIVAAVLAALVLGTVALYLATRTAEPAPGIGASGRPAVAVMRFEDHTGDEETAWLSGGLPSMLLTGLAQTQGLDVISTERIQEVLKNLGQGDIEDLDPGLVPETARRAGAGAVVVGSIYSTGPDIRVDIQVQDVGTGRLLSAHSLLGSDVFPLVDGFTDHIRATLHLADAPAGLELTEVTTTSLEAYELYWKGLEADNLGRGQEAATLWHQAVEIDPTFALAYFELWCLHSGWGVMTTPQGTEYRRKTFEHLDRLPERDRLLAEAVAAREDSDPARAAEVSEELIARHPDEEYAYVILWLTYEWGLFEPDKALSTLERAVAALPKSGDMHCAYTWKLRDAGRFDEARQHAGICIELMPLAPRGYNDLGDYYLVTGQPESALEQFARALEVEPSADSSHTGRAWAYGMLGDYGQALREAGEFEVPQSHNFAAFMLSRVGRYREAEERLEEGLLFADSSQNAFLEFTLHMLGASLALERGDHERALHHARQAVATSHMHVQRELRQSSAQNGHALCGLAEARYGDLAVARDHLGSLRTLLTKPHWKPVDWLLGSLEGEIALAAGDLNAAEVSFRAAEPEPKMLFRRYVPAVAVCMHHHPSRDGLARVARARGDLDTAIAIYRRLNTPGLDNPWTSVLEPRYVLEVARLFDQKGDHAAARGEYERFLELWKDADPDLPELDEARTRLAVLEGARS